MQGTTDIKRTIQTSAYFCGLNRPAFGQECVIGI